jgi:hypothetical protein
MVTVRQDLEVRGFSEFKTIGATGWVRAKVKGGSNGLKRKLAELQQNGYDVEYDYVVRALATPNDPGWGNIAGAMNKIGAPAAWDLHTGSAAVTVCVIDTGARAAHARNSCCLLLPVGRDVAWPHPRAQDPAHTCPPNPRSPLPTLTRRPARAPPRPACPVPGAPPPVPGAQSLAQQPTTRAWRPTTM